VTEITVDSALNSAGLISDILESLGNSCRQDSIFLQPPRWDKSLAPFRKEQRGRWNSLRHCEHSWRFTPQPAGGMARMKLAAGLACARA